jgi:hypothetical protein
MLSSVVAHCSVSKVGLTCRTLRLIKCNRLISSLQNPSSILLHVHVSRTNSGRDRGRLAAEFLQALNMRDKVVSIAGCRAMVSPVSATKSYFMIGLDPWNRSAYRSTFSAACRRCVRAYHDRLPRLLACTYQRSRYTDGPVFTNVPATSCMRPSKYDSLEL